MAAAWTNHPLNIGVIGASGVGKSTFINALRRLRPTDHGAAATDIVESTLWPTAYDHPRNPSVKLWDLPGVGTPHYPRIRYLKQIEFIKYDFFIIICCTRFTEDDLWFAREIRNAKKRFYFVRTKLDNDVQNDKEDYPETHNEESVKSKIKANCITELARVGFTHPSVFLVCKNPTKYEFPTLETTLASDVQQLKKETELLRLATETERRSKLCNLL